MSKNRIFRRMDGTHAFASASDSWFGMPKTTNSLMTPGELFAHTGMGHMTFTEHDVRAYIRPESGFDFEMDMPAYKAVVLNEKGMPGDEVVVRRTPAAIVGHEREVLQFEELLEPAHRVLDVSGGHIEAGGLTANATSWFFFIRLPEEVTIGGDTHAQYLMCRDGLNHALTVSYLANRLWCFNMFPAAIAAAKDSASTYRLLHRRGARFNVQAVRDVMQIGYAATEEMSDLADELKAVEMSSTAFIEYADHVLGGPPKDDAGVRARNNYQRRNEALLDLFRGDTVQTTLGSNDRPTRWTAYQALTEYLDHRAPVRGTMASRSARRVERIVAGDMTSIKHHALEVLA